MIQLIQPNLNQSGTAGWCLQFVENCYNIPHLSASAKAAWNATHLPHPNEQPPDAMVPVYWTYFDVSENVEFGHIAVWVPGKGVFSSPFDKTEGNQWFASIQAVTDRINKIKGANSHYLGWSEDLAGERIVKEGVYMPNAQEVTDFWNKYISHPLDDKGVTYYTTQPWSVLSDDILVTLKRESDEKEAALQQQVDSLTAANQKLVSQLQDQSSVDPATKAEIDQTSQDVSWIRALLSKIFK